MSVYLVIFDTVVIYQASALGKEEGRELKQRPLYSGEMMVPRTM